MVFGLTERSDLLWVDIPTIELHVSPCDHSPSSETYFGCTAVPDDNFGGHARVVQPFDVLLVALDLVPVHERDIWRCHRSFAVPKQNVSALGRNPSSDDGKVRQSEGLGLSISNA